MDNTRVKEKAWTITQEFAKLAMDHTEPTNTSPTRARTVFVGSILDEETGELEYTHLIKHSRYKKHGATLMGMKLDGKLREYQAGSKEQAQFFSSTKQMFPKTAREMSNMDALDVTTEEVM